MKSIIFLAVGGVLLSACEQELGFYEEGAERGAVATPIAYAQELPPDAGAATQAPDARPATPDALRADTVAVVVAPDARPVSIDTLVTSPDTRIATQDTLPPDSYMQPVLKLDANLNWPQDPKDPESAPPVPFSIDDCGVEVTAKQLCDNPKLVAFGGTPVQCGTCTAYKLGGGGEQVPLSTMHAQATSCAAVTRIRWSANHELQPWDNQFSTLTLWAKRNPRNFDRVICVPSIESCDTFCTTAALARQ